MKRTHKFKEMHDVARVVAKASSLKAAAQALGVDESTLHRWLKAGKVKRPRSKAPAGKGEAPAEVQALAGWADTVRAEYVLSGTDLELLQLAADALVMAKTSEHERDRLAAMARFQQLVRQLNLDAAAERVGGPTRVGTAPTARPAVSRAAGDPRAALMAVK